MTSLFVHIPRTGGTFLREYFRMVYGKNIIQFGHTRLAEGIQFLRQLFIYFERPLVELDNYFKFTFIRNPWDWYVSRYFYFRRSPVVEKHVSITCDSGLQYMDFIEKFPIFKEHMVWGSSECLNFWLSYRYRDMCFVDGKDFMDYVGRFEDMEGSINEIFKRCDATSKISYQPFYHDAERRAHPSEDRLKDKIFNDTVHEHYSYYYDQELIDLVYEKDKEIIDRFGYQYEDKR